MNRRPPPYHLRINKAVDRLLLIEIIRHLAQKQMLDPSSAVYYGLGGPFLEDCRAIRHSFPGMRIVSIEKCPETYKRQQFHRFTKTIDIRKCTTQDLLFEFEKNGTEGTEIVWLDYTKLRRSELDEYDGFLRVLSPGAILKITLPSRIDDFEKRQEEFADWLPGDIPSNELVQKKLPLILQRMLMVVAQRAIPSVNGESFEFVHSCTYSDGTPMISVTGMRIRNVERSRLHQSLADWRHYCNPKSDRPTPIDLPFLSIKERLRLEQYLPIVTNTGKSLAKALGYRIEGGEEANLKQFQQYAEFYNEYPHFVKAVL